MYPVIDLNEVTTNGAITVAVGEANDAGTTGVVTVTIKNGAQSGGNLIKTLQVSNLNATLQTLAIPKTPATGKIHHVTAVLVLASDESSSDDEYIQL